MLWSEFIAVVRRSMLDDVTEATWSNAQILDYIRWALTTFSDHTVPRRRKVYNASTIDPETGMPYDVETRLLYPAPDDLYGLLENEGQVWVRTPGGNIYLDPARLTPGMTPRNSAKLPSWDWENDMIRISQPLGLNSELVIDYFGRYDVPDETMIDTVPVPFPAWAERAMACLVTAYALDAPGVQSATIDRWKSRDDSGNPEHNALREHQKHLYEVYQQEISRFPATERVNAFRWTKK